MFILGATNIINYILFLFNIVSKSRLFVLFSNQIKNNLSKCLAREGNFLVCFFFKFHFLEASDTNFLEERDCNICCLSDPQGVGSHWSTEDYAEHHFRTTSASDSVDDKGKCVRSNYISNPLTKETRERQKTRV